MKKRMLFCLMTLVLALAPVLRAEQLFTQSFADTPIDMLVDFYNEWTGRTLIVEADLSQKITLKFSKLTKDEAMQAIETVLSMNGIALIPMGDKFLKVVSIANARQEGMEIMPFDPDKKYTASDRLMTQVIPLRYVVYTDVQELVQHLIHGYGKVIKMDRINSILVTDTSANIGRIVDAISLIDQPLEKIEPRIYELKYAEAQSVASKLQELVEAAKTEKSSQSVVAAPRSVPGVIRSPITRTASTGGDSYADETQIVQGEVKFVSDERTNILIIFSKAANFDFFDNIIKVLDVLVDPAVITEVVNLEYATAADISSILNEFVGAAQETEKTNASGTGNTEGSKTVDEIVKRAVAPTGRDLAPDTKSAIGRLSADTKIIPDDRSNSLLLMGRKSDIAALKTVISTLDVMLEQVMIEAVILNVNLSDDLDTGVKWVYDKAMIKTNGITSLLGFTASDLVDSTTNFTGSALSYYGSFPSINMSALITAAKTDGNARILSTPVVLTTDNTEATITIADEYPVVTATTYSSSYGNSSSYEYTTVGVSLTVTPHINPQRFVLMEITQSADDINGYLAIDENDVPIIGTREITATVAVQDRTTIVLGGLVRKSTDESSTKIPLLGDIPFLGWLFSSHSVSDARSELVVLLTPYVLTNPEEAQREAARRYNASAAKDSLWPKGWSESPLRKDEEDKDTAPEKKGFLKSIFESNDTPETTEEPVINPN